MSTIKVDKLEQRTGCTATVGGGAGKTVTVDATTVTLGRCSGTVNLASGASQTGFGRTGTVDWCTTAKTSPFAAVSGDGFFVNTTGGAITVTLPSSPNAGDIVAFADYANTWATACKDVTLCRNGSKINGGCFNATLNTMGQSVTLVYVDGTRGWKNVQDSTSNVTGAPSFIVATGGTITNCGNFRIHTFTGDGNFCISTAPTPGNNNVDYLIVGGGGSGNSGGGGAGGFRESHTDPVSGPYTASPLATSVPLPVSAQNYAVTVGGGGSPGNCGSNSIFSTITSSGGGKGSPQGSAGTAGGSGGGAGRDSNTSGGAGNTPPVSPPQGNPGGSVTASAYAGGGGGGGASAAGTSGGGGSSGGGEFSGGGGDGHGTEINPAAGTPGPSAPLKYFAGGGSGYNATGSGALNPSSTPSPGLTGKAGVGGGGQGYGANPAVSGSPGDGTDNTGGGAGSGSSSIGGSGIVIIRYKYQ